MNQIDPLDEICVYCGKDKGSHFGPPDNPFCYKGKPLGRHFRGLAEKRQVIAKSIGQLRSYRKENRLCRECAVPLEKSDITRCYDCKVAHACRETELVTDRQDRKLDNLRQ